MFFPFPGLDLNYIVSIKNEKTHLNNLKSSLLFSLDDKFDETRK